MSNLNIVYVYSKMPNLTSELKLCLPTVQFHNVESDAELKKAEVIVADYDLMIPNMYNLQNLKWMQGTWAGLDLLTPHINKPLPFILTRFSNHRFGQIMAEYIITHITIIERDLLKVFANQQQKLWSRDGNIFHYRSFSDLSIGIMGLGSIGEWIARCFSMLGAKIIGYGRKPSPNQQMDFISPNSYYTKSNINNFLSNCDYIINTLPSTPETAGLLNGDVLKSCADRKTVLINVARGSIINENDLICALENGWLSHAVLDVFETEPLPKDSRLWATKQVSITPHVSAISRTKHVAEHFKDNWNLYVNNLPLLAVYSFDKGY
ncbi:hypothetical protein RI129_004620 [Pyrocoelia pectoralis]|uniref:D-isomer specific 2-hydroxyacid dehydrogenase NAD-binding domain-containing protein n=1 Tax=Pyrocoelia pectoralis TaxID=417401 RepID=A0AAN7VJM4_9COLE